MRVEKLTVQSCGSCGGNKQYSFKIDRPIATPLLEVFIKYGFVEAKHFTKVGLLYVDSDDLIVSGPMGKNRLNVKCKKSDCDQILNDFENLLSTIS